MCAEVLISYPMMTSIPRLPCNSFFFITPGHFISFRTVQNLYEKPCGKISLYVHVKPVLPENFFQIYNCKKQNCSCQTYISYKFLWLQKIF